MGLFKKRETDPAEIERLKAEIASMGARLNASEEAKSELDGTVRSLATRLNAPTPPPPEPPPNGPVVNSSEIDKLNAKIERLSTRLDEPGVNDAPGTDPAEIERLGARIDQLNARIDETPEASPTVDPGELDRLASTMQRISDRIDEIDQRITSISTELANQISELSNDFDAVDGNAAPTDEIVTELRDAQTRLAGEQARYQIAFRQDLADLADRLKRA